MTKAQQIANVDVVPADVRYGDIPFDPEMRSGFDLMSTLHNKISLTGSCWIIFARYFSPLGVVTEISFASFTTW
jgi:hypothetical protein